MHVGLMPSLSVLIADACLCHPLAAKPSLQQSVSCNFHLSIHYVQIGVNLNLVSQTPWMTPQLQFVPGLGPRKALALLKWAQRQDHVNARRPLYRDVGSPLGKKVFW